MDRPETSTVAGCHILVEALYGISPSELTKLLVHVVGARTRVIAEPDTKVLDFQWPLLMNLWGKVEKMRGESHYASSVTPAPPAS